MDKRMVESSRFCQLGWLVKPTGEPRRQEQENL